jgi:hypothetical protein
MTETVYRLATPADESRLRAMLRDNPMDGWVDLSLEREPDYFAAADLYGRETSVIAETVSGENIGMYACTQFSVYLDGVVKPALYLHNLRVNRRWRHHIRFLRGGFASIAELVPDFATAASCFTSIGSGNRKAWRILEAGLSGLPRYCPQGEMVTLALPLSTKRHSGNLLRRAQRDDLPALLAFHQGYATGWQFAPCLDKDWLLCGGGLQPEDFWLYEVAGKIRFCAALWDQGHCKQAVVHGYRSPLGLLRPLYNFGARLLGRNLLPAIGQNLAHLFIAFAAFDDGMLVDEHELALDCIAELLFRAREKPVNTAILGLAAAHPLQDKIARRFHADAYRTRIETVSWSGQATFDNKGGNRLVQAEVALL